ncbi:hypothetical protein KZ813_06065 [Sphingomonas sp. RHCKR7]|uniref:hypothetical protein n=1 Tax=Sphingomonas folli TaxID=2862497 RepID=UPI001CA5CFF9|nr:hypothetical protein [Sphingomonas folli]MBW6526400.1 hypothetical protein [Sphingomonas folli]
MSDRVRAIAEGLRAAAGLARMRAGTGEPADRDDDTGRAFMVFAAELAIVADQMQGRIPVSPEGALYRGPRSANEAVISIIRSTDGRGASATDVSTAEAEGRDAGGNLARSACENPYGHDIFELRTAWFNGFSAGRVRSAHERGEDY